MDGSVVNIPSKNGNGEMTDRGKRAEELLQQWQTWYHEHQVWLSEVDPEGADRRISLDAATIKYFRGEYE